MKKIVAFVLLMVLLLSSIGVNAAQIYYDNKWHTYEGNIFSLKVNGETLNCEVPPIVFDGYSVVPARDVFEFLGAKVEWVAETQKVIVKYEGTTIEVFIDKKTVRENGKTAIMPISPKLINGKTMIPVRYIAEALGFDVDFDSNTDTIIINTKKESKPVVPEVSNPSATPTYDIRLSTYSYSEDKGTVSAVFTFTNSVKYTAFMLKEPYRLVVDTENTQFPTSLKSAQTGYENVTGIRIGQQTKGVRIVFDLVEELEYDIKTSGKKLIVKIGENIEENTNTPETEEPDEPQKPVIPDPPTYAPSRTVYLDPGHGGDDPGAIFTDEDGTIWKESNINLGVALKVKSILEKNNVKVIMSRETDKTVDLVKRPQDANAKQATLFVSVHTNSFFTDTAYGIETWGTLEYSATYAGITDKDLAENIQSAVIKKTGGYNRGVKDSTTLAVLRHSIMPSVLIEVGFISNTDEREKMFNESYRQKLADGIAEGILKTLDEMGL